MRKNMKIWSKIFYEREEMDWMLKILAIVWQYKSEIGRFEL